eukprot:7358720-Alexandrium_andersonii.AAC.1
MAEPVAWRGGLMHPIYKGQADPGDCEAYRAVALEDTSAKINHRIGRALAFKPYSRFAQDTQYGGLPAKGSDMAAQTVRLFLQHAHHKALSAGVLFMDLKNAFYSVQRAFEAGGGRSPARTD